MAGHPPEEVSRGQQRSGDDRDLMKVMKKLLASEY